MTKLPNRNPVPEPIKRIVRQQCGFGCCKCGLPIIEYHHIVPRSENPDDIMLLCPLHHHEATTGAMKEPEQLSLKAKPFNIENNIVEGQLKINQRHPVIGIGTVQFVGEGDFILVDNESLLSMYVNDGRLEISVKLYDPAGELIAQIENNEWVSGDPLPWDLIASFQYLKISHKKRAIDLEINARVFPLQIRAELWKNKQNFHLEPTQIRFDGVVKNFSVQELCFVGMRLHANSSKGISMEPDPKLGKASMVSRFDLGERIQEGLDVWDKLNKEKEKTEKE